MAKLKRGRGSDVSDEGLEEQDMDVQKVKKAKNMKVSNKSSSASSGKNEKAEPFWEVSLAVDHSEMEH